MNPTQPTLLIINASHYLREKAILSLYKDGYSLIFCESGSGNPLLSCSDNIIYADLDSGKQAIADIYNSLNKQNLNPDAVLTFSEWYVELASELAKKLNIPGIPLLQNRIGRDKYQTKKILHENGLFVGFFKECSDPVDALSFAEEKGFPVVLKPLNLGASEGVIKADDQKELNYGIKFVQGVLNDLNDSFIKNTFLIESYVPGKEFSVETISDKKGRHAILHVTEKLLSQEPFFDEVGHIVHDEIPSETKRAISDYALRILNILNVKNSFCHIEVKFNNQPCLIEMALRPGGDKIIDLLSYSYGVNPYSFYAAALTKGITSDFPWFVKNTTAVFFCYRNIQNDVDGYSKILTIKNNIPNIIDFRISRDKFSGEKNTSPFHWRKRCGYFVVKGNSRSDILDTKKEITSFIKDTDYSLFD